jgi:hypothetical protein
MPDVYQSTRVLSWTVGTYLGFSLLCSVSTAVCCRSMAQAVSSQVGCSVLSQCCNMVLWAVSRLPLLKHEHRRVAGVAGPAFRALAALGLNARPACSWVYHVQEDDCVWSVRCCVIQIALSVHLHVHSWTMVPRCERGCLCVWNFQKMVLPLKFAQALMHRNSALMNAGGWLQD